MANRLQRFFSNLTLPQKKNIENNSIAKALTSISAEALANNPKGGLVTASQNAVSVLKILQERADTMQLHEELAKMLKGTNKQSPMSLGADQEKILDGLIAVVNGQYPKLLRVQVASVLLALHTTKTAFKPTQLETLKDVCIKELSEINAGNAPKIKNNPYQALLTRLDPTAPALSQTPELVAKSNSGFLTQFISKSKSADTAAKAKKASKKEDAEMEPADDTNNQNSPLLKRTKKT